MRPTRATVTTTTIDGKKVPFVVRVQNVVINRSVTRLAVLDDPHARGRTTRSGRRGTES